MTATFPGLDRRFFRLVALVLALYMLFVPVLASCDNEFCEGDAVCTSGACDGCEAQFRLLDTANAIFQLVQSWR